MCRRLPPAFTLEWQLLGDQIILTEKDFAQWSILDDDGSLGAQFLTAVTSNTTVIFIGGWFAAITRMPVDGFGVNGTHFNTGTAIGAYSFIDSRSRADLIPDERPHVSGRRRDRRLSNHLKVPVNKGFYIIAKYFNILVMISSKPGPLSGF